MPAYTAAGISRYVVGLLEGFAAVSAPGVVALISRRDDGDWWRPLPRRGIAVRRAATPCHHPLERWALPLEALRGRPALFHAVDHVGPGLRPFRTVVTVHDLAFWRYPWTHSAASRRHYAAAARTLPRADAVICVSASVRRELLAALPLDPARVHTVHNGIAARFRPVPDATVPRRYGLERPYVLAVGTIEPRKNLPLLLAAARRLNRPELDIALVGAGGWEAENVRQTVRRLGLDRRVRYLGRVPDHDLPALYTQARLFAFPSLYEGFAFPPLEALACGTPVVALDTGPLPEVCGRGDEASAELVAPSPAAFAAAMARLLDDPAHREALAARGRERARRFTWRRCAEETLRVYATALGGPLS